MKTSRASKNEEVSIASTRREFLKLSALGLAATTAAPASLLAGPASGAAPAGEIEVWITAGEKRCARSGAISWRPASNATPTNAIALHPENKFQDVLGFGAAFTDAACYTLNRLAPDAREALFHEMFHPSQMALSVCRVCMGSSDYSTSLYSYDEGDPDPDLRRFSIDHDRAYILPMLREARQVQPDLFLFASPWSPPGWMKAGGSMLGGSMRQKYLPQYAQYFLKFLQGYAAENVPVQGVTPQNEVDTDQDGRMPACIWPQEYEIAFVRNHLGPLLRKNNLDTQIWILDHNYNLWGRALCELDAPGLREFCNAVAWHGYVGGAEMIDKVHDAHPDASMHWTEGGPDYTSPDYQTDWTTWGVTFTGALRHWCRSLTAWNFALDEQGRPNIGPFPCGGVVTVDSKTRAITHSGQFWALAHFGRFIRRGARRFDSQSAVHDLHHVALENPGGSSVLVVTNSGPARTVTLQMNGMQAELSLEHDSLTTYSWK
jgi:glucosylceramidase